jgi:hypothetical protein
MKKIIFFLTILLFVFCAGQSYARMNNFYYNPNGLAVSTGIVQATGLNSIDIYDEERKRLVRFIYLEDNKQFHRGDYVRIHYHPETSVVAIIKRMTVLEYRGDGQNLGNIFRIQPKD